MAESNSLPSYARGLTTKNRECYLNKLTLANSDPLPDPCASSEWVEDVSKWPDIYTVYVFGGETELVTPERNY